MACSPILWSVGNGIVIRDLKRMDFPAVFDFLLRENFDSNVLLHAVNLKNCRCDVEKYFEILEFIMKDDASLIAIDEKTDQVVGVVLAKPMFAEDYSWSFWKIIVANNRNVRFVMNFARDMVINNLPKMPRRDASSSYHVFVLCIGKSYKGLNQKPRLLIDAYKVARSLGLPKLSFVAFSLNDQIRAERIGMIEQTRLVYANYKSSSTTKTFIPRYPAGQYYAVHYEMDVGPKCNMSVYESRVE